MYVVFTPFFFNLDSQISRQHIKSNEALILHKKYTSILHHVRYVPGVTPNSKIIPENYLFTRVKDFKKGKINILLQGDSWIEQQVRKIESHRILKNFSKNKDVGVINAGNYSYSPSPMMLQLDILEKDFDLRPDILVAFFDQSDLGDENCRYKRRRVFNKDGKLISLKPEKYSWHLFDYTKIHNESEIFFSDNNDFLKSSHQLMLFRQCIRRLMVDIKQQHGNATPLYVFPVMPISCCIEMGRARMPKADMDWIIYDHDPTSQAFTQSIVLTGGQHA